MERDLKGAGYKIACIGDLDVVTGFGLAGVSRFHVHVHRDETLAKLKEFFEDPDIGLILLTNPIAQELRWEIRELRRKKPVPLILAIPDKTGWRPEIDELRELIKRTVGAEVVIRREE
jgi:V/A-type H+-transporting ATPase subunit F